MINKKYVEMTNKKSVIRETFMYGIKRGKEIGYENVFDYSLGNPSVPCPSDFNKNLIDLVNNESPIDIHGYSPSLGIDSVRESIATSLNKRFDMEYKKENIFMAVGAAGAIAHAIRAITVPNDEVITFAPYFPEYNHYVNGTGAILKVVSANTSDFQINFKDLENTLNPKVMAVLINTPNNPSGIVYNTDTIIKLSNLLKLKEKEYNHPIYLVSDEPYREIVFKGVDHPFVSKYYDNTLMCYSFSKSLSLPGERIGYIAVNPKALDAKVLVDVFGQISREIGHNCPPSLIQKAVSTVIDQTSDLSVYEKNATILYDKLTSLGFEIVKPGGTFYMFPKALESDAIAFCEKARKYDLLLVPSDSFGVPGYFRIAYCIDTKKVEKSLSAFEKLAKEYLND